MAVALEFLRLGFLSCAVFATLITIVVLHGKCCNRKRRLADAAVTGSEGKSAPSSSSSVDSDAKPCAAVYAITGQPQLPSLVECHVKPVLYEPSYSQATSKPSSTSKRKLKNSTNRIESPLSSIDEGVKNTILSQKRSKQKSSPSANVLVTIEEDRPMTGDLKKSASNRDDEDGKEHVCVSIEAPNSRQRAQCQLTTPIERSSDVAAIKNRDSSVSINTYCTINTVNSYEALPSTDSGFPSTNSQVSQYDWIIRSDSGSRSDEQASSQRGRWSAEEEDEGQHDGGVFDPQYDPLSPRYCETLLPLDGTYEALKKPDYPATISTAHPVTQSQQIELQNMIKADVNPKRNTVTLG